MFQIFLFKRQGGEYCMCCISQLLAAGLAKLSAMLSVSALAPHPWVKEIS